MVAEAIERSGTSYDFVAELGNVRAPLRRYSRRLTGDNAAGDDLVQDTLLRAWSARDRFAAGTNFKAWLFRIARNSFLSGRRRHNVYASLPEEAVERLLTAPASQETGLHFEDLHRAVATLPAALAEALLAVSGEAAGYDEVAAALGIPTGTLRSRVRRARAAVMDLMDHPPAREAAAEGQRTAPVIRATGDAAKTRRYAAWKASGSRMIG